MRNACIALSAVLCVSSLHAGALGPEWAVGRGTWRHDREIIPMVHQAAPTGRSLAVRRRAAPPNGAWRATVVPSIGCQEAGLQLGGTTNGIWGFEVVLRRSSAAGGFALRSLSVTGGSLWADKWAPWSPYEPYVVECVVESGRVRAQMFEWDGKTLVSQSPWIKVNGFGTLNPFLPGFCTRDGMARFWGLEHSDRPLSPIVPDAPNKRRLVQGDDSPWVIVGPGNWMWVTARKQRLRQYAAVDRSKVVNRSIRGVHRVWECCVKVYPSTGGAGLFFQANERAEGLLAWLGGRPGSGSLMLYDRSLKNLWSGKQGHWRYNADYVLRAETRKGQARAQLLQADGKTLLQDTGWVKTASADTPGCIGFHTWKGPAEFWSFSEGANAPAASRASQNE